MTGVDEKPPNTFGGSAVVVDAPKLNGFAVYAGGWLAGSVGGAENAPKLPEAAVVVAAAVPVAKRFVDGALVRALLPKVEAAPKVGIFAAENCEFVEGGATVVVPNWPAVVLGVKPKAETVVELTDVAPAVVTPNTAVGCCVLKVGVELDTMELNGSLWVAMSGAALPSTKPN